MIGVEPPVLDEHLIGLPGKTCAAHHEQARHAALVIFREHQALVGVLRQLQAGQERQIGPVPGQRKGEVGGEVVCNATSLAASRRRRLTRV